jgi:drug/metabolite transporter (DMT)-like permease
MKKIYLKLVAVAFIWGGTWIAGRIVAPHLSPLVSSALRFCMTSVCFLWILTRQKLCVRPSLPTLGYLGFMALFGIGIYNLCFFEGLRHISASRAALVVATNPICSLIAAHFIFKEPISAKGLLGILISLCGATLVITQGHIENIWNGGIGIGEIMVFGCVLSWVAYTLLSKKAMTELSPLIASSYSIFIGTVMLLIAALVHGDTFDLGAIQFDVWGAIAYLGIIGTFLAYKWYFDGVKEIGPSGAVLFINLVPVFAVLMGVTVLGESINLVSLLGGLCVILGITLTLFKPAAPTDTAHVSNKTA